MNDRYVITISRLCGAGGTSIGKKLSARLGIPMYGRELLRMASDESGISEDLYVNADERVKNGALLDVSRKVYRAMKPTKDSGDFTADHNLFQYQAKVLKELAERESYIVIGRCGDYILRDFPNVVRLFITADESTCVKHEMKQNGWTKKQAVAAVTRYNNERANFYKYYTDQTWSNAGNYDLCINTSHLSFEESTEMIIEYLRRRFPNFETSK